MNTELLQHEEFGELRIKQVDGEPWFVAQDVCNSLGYSNTKEAIRKLDDDEKLESRIMTSGQSRKVILTNESGLYHLIFKSGMPKATAFRKWVTSEVLPSLRKNKSYTLPEAAKPSGELRISYKVRPTRFLMGKFLEMEDKQDRIVMTHALNELIDSIALR